MKMLIKFIPYFVIAIMATAITFQQIHIKTLKEGNKSKDYTIKELLKINEDLRKLKTYAYHFNCQLHVRDQSKITMYGRNNRGTQIVPSVKTYELKIDSTNFIMSIKPPIE